MYLPLAAIVTGCVVAAWRLGNASGRRPAESAGTRKRLGFVSATAVLALAGVLGWRTFDRNRDYRDTISIWKDTVNKRPQNVQALTNLGCAYSWAGQSDTALHYFDKAIELNPDYAEAYNNRGADLYRVHRLAEALRDLDEAIKLKPAYANAYCNRAAVRLSAGRYNEALADCDRAIELLPEYAQAYGNRGNYFLLTGRAAEAMPNYDEAIALQPGYADAYINRASARYVMKEYDKALSDVKAYERLGGRPPSDLVEALLRATGRSKQSVQSVK
jgi:tetratricopeptide (TPR) repeat protein